MEKNIKKECVYVYDGVTSLNGRVWHSTVNQLYLFKRERGGKKPVFQKKRGRQGTLCPRGCEHVPGAVEIQPWNHVGRRKSLRVPSGCILHLTHLYWVPPRNQRIFKCCSLASGNLDFYSHLAGGLTFSLRKRKRKEKADSLETWFAGGAQRSPGNSGPSVLPSFLPAAG